MSETAADRTLKGRALAALDWLKKLSRPARILLASTLVAAIVIGAALRRSSVTLAISLGSASALRSAVRESGSRSHASIASISANSADVSALARAAPDAKSVANSALHTNCANAAFRCAAD